MNPLMEKLHDIEGLDVIGLWPLALGWWISIGCGMLVLGGLIWFFIHRLKYLRSWKRDTFKKLAYLEKDLSTSTSKDTIATLSEYLRRIAMRRFPRKECAGLVGETWLKWLQDHDPKQFDWTSKGKLLIEIPYAPDHRDVSLIEIKELIQAVRNWVG
jgi:hypothetical protein